ncbi:hypothetical protein H8M03_07020 [Sphingomonas sabuli]|uniref:Uncharacterized protein n=1 Tax=Sphingomonas sabuli TaxID=2764186 RepID=A0A7G9KZL8_9SPHN|nr:hypothetical protein [Sphingomonas sabuli]QNM81817.1 hypothetical protein H8M03_07020 [Sphingomonas sabuli]
MTTAASDAAWKARSARKVRAANRIAIARGDEALPDRKVIENPATSDKDGKQWIGRNCPEIMRK